MSEQAYDISYLLDSGATAPATPSLRIVNAPPPVAPKPSLAAIQEALARELLQHADRHDALVEQYLRMNEVIGRATFGK